ncbi:phage tail fiber protein [Serratia nevei]|nr:phage tail fiber protein [Serratia nevei]
MSVPNQTPYNIYTANGLTTVFPYEFYLLNAGDLAVSLNGSVITSGYTISGVGNVDGGEVLFLTPPDNGATVMLERAIPTYRLTDYQDNGDLLADTVNKDFDRLWMAIQQAFIYLGLALTRPLLGGPFNAKGYRIENLGDPVNESDAATKRFVKQHSESLFNRTLRVGENHVAQIPPVAIRKNKVLAFNEQGNPIAVLPGSGTATDVMIELAKPTGSSLIGHHGTTVGQALDDLEFTKYVPSIYYGSFFENVSNAVNIVTSHDGITFSDPIRLKNPNGDLLRARDPSLVFYNGMWLMATTANTPGSVDLIIYSSLDLVSWVANPIKLNGDNAICSNTVPWDGGTVPASLLWAGELVIDRKTGKLHLVISIIIGVDGTTGRPASRLFGTYISELTDLSGLKFSVPVRVSCVDHDGGFNKYSRIDATIAYDDVNNRYLMAVKRENYGVIDIFSSSTISGGYSYINSISGLQDTDAGSGYFRRSSVEAPALYRMKDGYTWVIAFDPNDTFDGILYVSSSDGFATLSVPKKLEMARFRHGSITAGVGLPPQAIKNLEDARNGISGYSALTQIPLNFIKLTESCSIIPRSDTVYWSDSDITVTLVAPNAISGNMNYPRRFYFCLRTNSRLIRMRISGAVAGGVWDIGWGVNSDRLIEFFYENLSNVYRSEAMGAVSYTQTRLKADAGTNSINASSVTWAPRHAKTYIITDSDGTMTINALPNMPVGTYFNIVIQSGTNSFVGLILKAAVNGNNMGMPTDWTYNGGGSNYDGKIIRLEKGSDLWFATR